MELKAGGEIGAVAACADVGEERRGATAVPTSIVKAGGKCATRDDNPTTTTTSTSYYIGVWGIFSDGVEERKFCLDR